MKKLFLLLSVFALASCTPTANEVSNNYKIPEALKDCSFHSLMNTKGSTITVVRCPNSQTTTKEERKNGQTTIVIDGLEYERKN